MIAALILALVVSASKSAAVVSDPMNGAVTPKAIPGARIDYTISVNNGTLAALDQDKTVISDVIPANTKFCVRDLGLAGSGPVAFTSLLSNLTYTFTSIGSTTDDVDFSSNNGATWTYSPSGDADGCDPAVTNIRLKPKGKLAAAGTANFRFRVMVK